MSIKTMSRFSAAFWLVKIVSVPETHHVAIPEPPEP